MNENDIVKEWEHAGFKCKVTKHPEMGHYCGYVLLPEDHPFTDRDDVDLDAYVWVHGGITYASWGEECDEKSFVVGFDCAHAGDFVPGSPVRILGNHKWTLEEVTEEVNHFAEQLTIPNLVERKLSQ